MRLNRVGGRASKFGPIALRGANKTAFFYFGNRENGLLQPPHTLHSLNKGIWLSSSTESGLGPASGTVIKNLVSLPGVELATMRP